MMLLLGPPVPAAQAAASYAHLGSFGNAANKLTSSTNGEFNAPNRVAVASTTGDIFVADTANNRVQVFKPEPTANLRNERQQLTVSATAGQFKLKYGGEATANIAFNASAGEVQSALEAKAKIKVGSVSVTGGPGDATGSTPYAIEFTGAFEHADVEQIVAENGTTPLSGGTGASVITILNGVSPATFLTSFAVTAPLGVAVDSSNGDAYTTKAGTNEVQKYANPASEYTLSFEGQSTGGEGTGDLVSSAATGTGNLTAGSNAVTSVVTSTGAFEIGQTITGGSVIPAATTITACTPSCGSATGLTLSKAATGTEAAVVLSASSKTITSVVTSSGAFVVGERISGTGIPAATTISAVGSGTLTLSAAITATNTTVSLGSKFANNATGAVVATALEKLSTIGAGNVTGTGTASAEKTISFTGALGSTNVPLLSGSGVTIKAPPTSTEGVPGTVSKFDPSENPPTATTTYAADGSFTSPALSGIAPNAGGQAPAVGGVAVNPTSHEVFLAFGKSVKRFDSAGVLQGSFDGSSSGTAFTTLVDLSLDDVGDVIVADLDKEGVARLVRFDSAGAFQATLTPAPFNPSTTTRRAIVAGADPTSGEVFATSPPALANEGGQLCQYETDAQTSCFGLPTFQERNSLTYLRGIAASGTVPGRLYVVGFDNSGEFSLPGSPRVQVWGTKEPPTSVMEPIEHAPAPPTPPCGAETGVGATEACFSGSVNPHGSPITSCRFEYLTQAQYAANGNHFTGAATEACVPTPGDGISPEDVEAVATGLQPNAEYRARLVAIGEGGLRGDAEAPPFTTLALAPSVRTGKATSISDTAATLIGEVNPHNSAIADCRFEYGTEEGSGQTVPCSVDPGSGNSPVQVTADVEGLTASTPYHFRLVADNGVEVDPEGEPGNTTATGEDAIFTTYPPVLFPQRHYELVSAADTNGVGPVPDVASADGEDYAYVTFLPSPPDPVSGKISIYVSSRHQDGSWTQVAAEAPAPPSGNGETGTGNEFFSADLAKIAFSTGSNQLDPDDLNKSSDTYLKQPGSSALTWLSRDPSIEGAQTEGGVAKPAYISPDGARVLFDSKRRLLPDDAAGAGQESLYQWDEGVLSLVSRIPSSGSSCDDAAGPACVGATLNSSLGSGHLAGRDTSYGAASPDGSRVVFMSGGSNRRLYVRIDGEKTVEASASAPGAPPISFPRGVNYWGADANDKDVFFSSSSPLTEDSTAPGTAGGSADLYRYNVPPDGDPANGELVDLTPSAAGAGVKRVYAVSDDGRRVYFTSTKRLNEAGELTEEGEGLQGAPGGPNLYFADLNGPEATLTFVATVDTGEDKPGQELGGVNLPQAWREAASSPDGSLLAFRDRLPAVPGRATGGRPQVFVYDAARDELSCASCPADGAEPATAANLPPARSVDGVEPIPDAVSNGITNAVGPHPRNVSTEGAVFFQTATPLVDTDTNDRIDVYEWRGGKLALISAGVGAQDSIFGSASEDGSTVFFQAADSLASGAQTGIRHIYAARVGPAPESSSPAPPCTGADCRGPSGAVPSQQGAGSSSFRGAGNLKVKRKCRKGKVRRKDRCVKKRSNRAKRAANKTWRAAR